MPPDGIQPRRGRRGAYPGPRSPIFVNPLLCPLRKHEVDVTVDVRMTQYTQSAILRGIISAAVEVVHPGKIKAYPATPILLYQGDMAW